VAMLLVMRKQKILARNQPALTPKP